MDRNGWSHLQSSIALRFDISWEKFLENKPSKSSAVENSLTLTLPMGFYLVVTQFTCSSLLSGPANTQSSGIDGLVTPIVDLYLKQSQAASDQNTAFIMNIKTAHFVEIYEDGYKLHLSQKINGPDVLDSGIVYVDDVLSPWYKTFEIILTTEPIYLLVSENTLYPEETQSQRQPFGRGILTRFLLDVARSTDIVFMAAESTEAYLQRIISGDDTPRAFAHSTIMQQCPVFADTLQTRADSSSIVHILVDIDPSALQLIINFIYLNQIEEPGNVRVVDWHYIFQLARRFRLDRLANRALEEMARSQWGHQHLDYEEIEVERAPQIRD